MQFIGQLWPHRVCQKSSGYGQLYLSIYSYSCRGLPPYAEDFCPFKFSTHFGFLDPVKLSHVHRLALQLFLRKKIQEEEKNYTWYLTHDTWHVTPDMWHLTCDTWHGTNGGEWTFSQNFSSLASLAQWINQWMSDKGDWRTAPATPDLLNIWRKTPPLFVYY